MRTGSRPRPWPSTLPLKLALLVAGPLLVALAVGLALYVGRLARLDADTIEARERRVVSWFAATLDDAWALTEGYLVQPPAAPAAAPGRRPIAQRLEGVGVVDAESNYLYWHGTPPEPWPSITESGAWRVRLDGVHTRLLVRAGPDGAGRHALASFIVDSRLASQAAGRLVPAALQRGVNMTVEFTDSGTIGNPGGSALPSPSPTDARVTTLRAPDGTPLARASVAPIPYEHALAQARSRALAWACVSLLVLTALLFDWRRLTLGAGGLIGALLAVLGGRLLLGQVRAPLRLLPPELGTAGAFGTSVPWRLADSPADLLLSSAAAYLIAVALRRHALALRDRRPAVAAGLVGAAAALLLGLVAWMVGSLARNSSVSVLSGPGFWSHDGQLVLAGALAIAMWAAAELLAALWSLSRGEAVTARRPTRLAVGIAFLPLALVGSLGLLGLMEQLALERLRSEYAPLVLEQEPRRRVALSSTLQHIRQAFSEHETGGVPASSQPDYVAYHFWVTSELFFAGYKSSLDFYTPTGELVSHFGFDLPLLDEVVEPADRTQDATTIRDEVFEPVAAVRQKLFHAELAVTREATLLGTVVGHVLDEPDNLAFLPGSQPYLAALGPGAPQHRGPGLADGPEYVLYDAPGTVMLSTLSRPPAMAEALVQAFDRDGSVDLQAGDDRYVGLAIQDDYHRLHLLVVPALATLERLAAAVRLALLGVLLLVLTALAPRLLRPREVVALVRGLRGSFYRKLLAALLLASMVPLVGLALFLRGYIETRGRETLTDSATQFASAAQRVLNDYAATQGVADEGGGPPLNDEIVQWLRNVIGQEIHVYVNGLLQATSKRELFSSGLLAPRLDGEAQRRLGREGLPYLVLESRLGADEVPVAYAPVDSPDPLRELVVAVPVVAQRQQIARAVERVADMILLSTVLLAGMLAVVAAYVARTVARPVRELVGATGRIAAGDYETRLQARTHDEVADLVRGFNSMAASLAAQRADLERRREYMERLLRHATTGVVSTDPRGRVVTLNPAARELLSSSARRPAIGESLTETLAVSRETAPLADLLARPLRLIGEPEEVDLERDGHPRRLRVVRIDLPEPGGGSVGRLILVDDVTELMRSNQLAAWAEMARAIAHEIKNPLTPIQLSTEHLQRLLSDRGVLPAADVEACLATVKKQVRTLYDIAGEFSAYAKLPALAPHPADPVAFMREVIGPYRASGLPGIEIEERFEPAGQVAIDAKVLGRAVINLIENAIQAMPDGGRLVVAVAADPTDDRIVLSIEDTGVGLAPEVRRRLFEPYFSTKSSGTGLGLAIVRRAVEAHQGSIEVESRRGRGTAFRIRLPRATPVATSSAAPLR